MTSTASFSTRARRKIVEDICQRYYEISKYIWKPEPTEVWSKFAGRRGGFEPREVVLYVTTKDMIPGNRLDEARNADIRMKLLSEFDKEKGFFVKSLSFF